MSRWKRAAGHCLTAVAALCSLARIASRRRFPESSHKRLRRPHGGAPLGQNVPADNVLCDRDIAPA
jgi:hypothetical protein